MNTISKQDYLYNKIVERINKIVGNKHGKNDRLEYYKANKHRLDNLCLVDIHNFNFEREVELYQDKYDELKKTH